MSNDRCVTAPLLLSKEIEKEGHCLSLRFEVVAHYLAGGSDTSPTPCQASLSKQIGMDGHRIEASHVFREVCPFDI